MAYTLPDLPYPFDALEPHIDARTMEIHHDKHHATYVTNVNAALEGTELADLPIEELLHVARPRARGQAQRRPQQRRRPLQPLALLGEHERLGRRRARAARSPTRSTRAFGSFADFQGKLKAAGLGQFGSGWAWLVHDGSGLAVARHAQPGQPDLAGQDAAAGRRRLGARLLPALPEPPPRLHRRVVERRRLGRGRRALRRRRLSRRAHPRRDRVGACADPRAGACRAPNRRTASTSRSRREAPAGDRRAPPRRASARAAAASSAAMPLGRHRVGVLVLGQPGARLGGAAPRRARRACRRRSSGRSRRRARRRGARSGPS